MTNSDGSSVDCSVAASIPGPKELVKTTQEDCQHDFDCEYADTGYVTQVKCAGKMNVYHYKQEVTNYYVCVYRGDCMVVTYPYTDKITNTWTENGHCIMENGRSCCPDGSLPVGGPPGWPPPGWSSPVIVGPDEPNPFK
jgi:hypothetical protein